MFDLNEKVLVGVEFWDFLGGKGTYDDLLLVFEEAGIILRKEIDAKMQSVGRVQEIVKNANGN